MADPAPLTIEEMGAKVVGIEGTITKLASVVDALAKQTKEAAEAAKKEAETKKEAASMDLTDYEAKVMEAAQETDPAKRKTAMKDAMELFENKKKKEAEAKQKEAEAKLESADARIKSLEAAAKAPKVTQLASMYATKVAPDKLPEITKQFETMTAAEIDSEINKLSLFSGIGDGPAVGTATPQTPYAPTLSVQGSDAGGHADSAEILKILNGGGQ